MMKIVIGVRAAIFLAVLMSGWVHAEAEFGDKNKPIDMSTLDREVLEILCANMQKRIAQLEAELEALRTAPLVPIVSDPPPTPIAVEELTLEDDEDDEDEDEEDEGVEEVDPVAELRAQFLQATQEEIDRLVESVSEGEKRIRQYRSGDSFERRVGRDIQQSIIRSKKRLAEYRQGQGLYCPNLLSTKYELGMVGRVQMAGPFQYAEVADVLGEGVVVIEVHEVDRMNRFHGPMSSNTPTDSPTIATFMVRLESSVGVLPGQRITLGSYYKVSEVKPYNLNGRKFELHLLEPVDEALVEQALDPRAR